ncbi:hypothetical protein JANAI62_11460 [Jannaschia pagri]|uniref:HTH araC/xylS-type domain-containing protein n=1 Tax=Jannaschia pagri TaxID=2829797 RepID=A0ABQ4NJE4_9RHOB|nr:MULTISPECIES: AraC family transcriptional regulator [unclassified Jannaschia]GIT90691.1 hypothetical protein JANAI61_11490 [Jannaschia sp. AI_61]GIT94523.1 hypothetical protein JANAI62_11460 [Jannaschia sp. AI_62]
MESETFFIDDYIAPNETHHVARKTLPARFPSLAHRHDYHEVMLIEAGRTAHWVNGASQDLEAGDLLCIRPNDTHALRASRAGGCTIVNVMFRSEIADHVAARYAPDVSGRFFWREARLPAQYHLSGTRRQDALRLLQDLRAGPRSLVRIEEFLLALVNRVVFAPDRLQGGAPPWLIAACAAAQTEAVYRIGAAGLVAAAGRSHEHVCRAMRRHLGTTPSAYVNGIRMEQAARMLDVTDLAIPDVAEALGIENLSHFYRLFGQQYGTTPRLYRKRHQKDPFRQD